MTYVCRTFTCWFFIKTKERHKFGWSMNVYSSWHVHFKDTERRLVLCRFIRCWDAKFAHEIYRVTVGLGGLGSGSELCIWSLLALRWRSIGSPSVKRFGWELEFTFCHHLEFFRKIFSFLYNFIPLFADVAFWLVQTVRGAFSSGTPNMEHFCSHIPAIKVTWQL